MGLRSYGSLRRPPRFAAAFEVAAINRPAGRSPPAISHPPRDPIPPIRPVVAAVVRPIVPAVIIGPTVHVTVAIRGIAVGAGTPQSPTVPAPVSACSQRLRLTAARQSRLV